MKLFTPLAMAAALMLGTGNANAFTYESVSPEAGSTIEVGEVITVTFPMDVTLNTAWYSWSELRFCFQGKWGEVCVYPYDTPDGITLKGKELKVIFNPSAENYEQSPGSEYVLKFDEGFMMDVTGQVSEEFAIPFVMAGGEDAGEGTSLPIEFTNNPGEGGEVEMLTMPIKFKIDPMAGTSYNEANPVEFYKNGEPIATSVSNFYDIVFQVEVEGIDGDIYEPGEYTIVIPAGTFANGELQNEEVKCTWTVVAPEDGIMLTLGNNDAASEVNSIELPIIIKVEPSEGVVYHEIDEFGSNTIELFKDFWTPIDIVVTKVDDATYSISTPAMGDAITEAGDYDLTIYESAFVSETAKNRETWFSWRVSPSAQSGTASIEPVDVWPESGYYVYPEFSGIEMVIARFPVEPELILNEEAEVAIVNMTSGEENICSVFYDIDTDEGYGYLYLMPRQPIAKNGTFMLIIPERTLTDAAGNYNPEFVYRYILSGYPSVEPIAVSPADESEIVGPFSSIILNFEGEVMANSEKIQILDAATEEPVAECSATVNYMEALGISVVNVEFNPAITIDGEYLVVFWDGAVQDASGNGNAMFYYAYNVTGNSTSELEYKVESVNPEPGIVIPAFYEGNSVTLTLNTTEGIGFAQMTVYVGGEWLYVFNVTEITANTLTFQNNAMEFQFAEGKEVECKFEFFNFENPPELRTKLGEYSCSYVGGTDLGYSFSNIGVTAQDFNPAPGAVLTEVINKVTIKFEAPVEFKGGYATEGGQMAAMIEVTAQSNDAKDMWTVEIPSGFLSDRYGTISLIMGFTDEEGKWVSVKDYDETAAGNNLYPYYSTETGGRTMIAVNYNVYASGAIVDVSPSAGQVSELYEIKLAYQDGCSWSWTQPLSAIKLYDAEGAEVACGASFESQENIEGWGFDSQAVNTYIIVTLSEKVTTPGEYSLVIPGAILNLGMDYNSVGYIGQTVDYTIQTSGIADILNSATSADVYNLQGVRLMKGANAGDLRTLRPGIYIVNGKKVVVK